MRRSQTLPIGELLRDVLKAQRLDTKLNETRLLAVLPEVLGSGLSKYIEDKSIKNRVLYLKIISPALRNELLSFRQKLIDNLNQKVGETVITDIRFN
ncbi:MAG: DUF721 domain-containing protein [Prevotellaceae bacterium]|jgi:predicted nucleic acid-binding Zn ribbon protein|nr:DUF721 domain-containing protein [Prevotellaceae bacterium]